MVFFDWLGQNWFDFLQSVGIVGGLLYNGFSLRIDAKARRNSNLFTLTAQNRDLLKQIYVDPGLSRVLDSTVDVSPETITKEEEWFIVLWILHFSSAYHTMKDRMLSKPEGLQKDVQWFFSLPITKVVWEKTKAFQDKEFVSFIEKYTSDA